MDNCLSGLLPCFWSPPTPEQRHSAEIDRQLAMEKHDFHRTHRLLLLGAGESGKSTIVKQMQLIHVDKFSERVRLERRQDIRNNLLDAIVSIVAAIPALRDPPIRFEHPENTDNANWILNNASGDGFDFPQEFYERVEALWGDRGVQAAFQRSNEYQLIDSAQYFLEKVSDIRREDYLPSEQDILRCRVLTRGIYELVFRVKNVTFKMIDVGGQRGERCKWFLCFNGVTAIIFVTAMSSYDATLREDPTKNRLVESLDIFRTVWYNKFLRHVPVILFLNKQDILRRKVRAGRSKIEDYFPEYADYTGSDGESTEPEDTARFFIRGLFRQIYEQDESNRCYSHFTCAIDTENIKAIFDDCRDAIQRRYLKESDLL